MALQEHGEVQEAGLPRRREELAPVGTGRMGSSFFRWRFAPAQLSAVLEHDRAQLGRRVFVDSGRGEVTLMAPSGLHETVSWLLAPLLLHAAQALSIPFVGVRSTTWRPPGSRRVEADESYCLGDVALRCLEVHRMDRPDLVDAFFDANPPQLVIEVERTHGDADRPDVYRVLGVTEMWRIDQSRNQTLSVEILELQHSAGWRAVHSSAVLPGLTPEMIGQVLEMARREGAQAIPGLLAQAGVGREERQK